MQTSERRKEQNRVNARIFYRRHRGKILRWQKNYYAENKRKRREAVAISERKQKRRFVDAYGGACECCGEKEIIFLTIEHIGRWGKEHRELLGRKPEYLDIEKMGFPRQRIACLCYNCNLGTKTGKPCSHWEGRGLPPYLEAQENKSA